MQRLVHLIALLGLLYEVMHAQGPPSIEWQRCYGGMGYDDGYSISPRPGGGFFVGSIVTSNDGDVSENPGIASAWVTAITEDGSIEWDKCYGNVGAMTPPIQVTTSPDGGFYLATTIFEGGGDIQCVPTNYEVWVIKADPIGTIQWQVCLGGSGSDFFQAMAVLGNGDLVIAGSTYSSDAHAIGNHGGTDALLARLNANGEILWTRCYGGGHNDGPLAISPTSNGDIIIAGVTRSSDGMLAGINTAPSNNTMAWLFRADGNGNPQWHKVYGGSAEDRLNCVRELPDGGLVSAGMTRSSDGDIAGYNGGVSDGWVLLMSGTGDLLSQRPLGGSGSEAISALVLAPEQHILLVGHSISSDGDLPGSNGGNDVWAVLLDQQLGILWSGTYGGSEHDFGTAVVLTDGAYLLGRTYSSDGDIVGHHGQSDVWLVSLAPWDDTSTGDANEVYQIAVYPNPASNMLTIDLGDLSGAGWHLTIIDALGRSVFSDALGAQRTVRMPVAQLRAGTYCVLLSRNDETHARRFIKLY